MELSAITNQLDVILEDINNEEAIVKFEIMCNTSFYNDLLNGYFFDFADIFDTLEFFLKINNSDKVENILIILSKYYSIKLSEKFNECLDNEEFEMCEILKNRF